MKKKKILFSLVAVTLIGTGYFTSSNIIKANKETKREATMLSYMVKSPKPKSVDEVMKEVPPKLVDLLKMPTDIPFSVNDVTANVNDLFNREEKRRIASGLKSFNKIEEKALGNTASFPYDEVTYEQNFNGNNISLSILANARKVETEYADPSEVKQINISDGSSAEYLDYGFSQYITWKDNVTNVTYKINIVYYNNEESKSKLNEQEIAKLIESFKYVE
ncbi:hypothetical protein [Heyndrickxia oleronia]|uniref:Lipoprotein n=1 Tax=Heyndrickxia oleronia TaxID=38875 RepID=A0AAW6T1J1_9BACI|nr:hypothetical protein [Heyndrickxia oleronia]MDH5163418.1 hypothetical protein [Heyndrickxia oleronia]